MIPIKVEELTSNIVMAKHIILQKDVTKDSEWSKQVQAWKMMVESAIAEREQATVVSILYETAEEQERLTNSLLQLVVRYNRYSHYHSNKCNNVQFIQDEITRNNQASNHELNPAKVPEESAHK